MGGFVNKKSLLAGSLFWAQAGKVIFASLVTDADGFAGRIPDGVLISNLYIKLQLTV